VFDDAGLLIGCVQLIPARMQSVVGASNQLGNVGFVQNLAVSEAYRRQGLGSALMQWCEGTARAQGLSEIWLAAAVEDKSTQALHLAGGYGMATEVFGNVLMRKVLDSAPTGVQPMAEAISSSESQAALGISMAALCTELSVQFMYSAIAGLGISVLLAPFGGPTVFALFLGSQLQEAGCSYFPCFSAAPFSLLSFDAAIGSGAAAGVLALRRSEWAPARLDSSAAEEGSHDEAGELLRQSVDAQLAPVRRILRGETRPAPVFVALGAWQLSIAIAEELYYRGCLQSGIALGGHALTGASGLSGAVAVAGPELVTLLLSSAFFGLVHSEWVDQGAPGSSAEAVQTTRMVWFRETATSSLLFGALFLLTQHRLGAPVACHALLNVVPLGWRELQRASDEAGQ